jgi:hypothetical protein
VPAELVEEPLGLSCAFSNGTRRFVTVGQNANPLLARDLLMGLTWLIHPHGHVDSVKTVTDPHLNLDPAIHTASSRPGLHRVGGATQPGAAGRGLDGFGSPSA